MSGIMAMNTNSDLNITYLTQDELRRLFVVIKDKRDKALFQLTYQGIRLTRDSWKTAIVT